MTGTTGSKKKIPTDKTMARRIRPVSKSLHSGADGLLGVAVSRVSSGPVIPDKNATAKNADTLVAIMVADRKFPRAARV